MSRASRRGREPRDSSPAPPAGSLASPAPAPTRRARRGCGRDSLPPQPRGGRHALGDERSVDEHSERDSATCSPSSTDANATGSEIRARIADATSCSRAPPRPSSSHHAFSQRSSTRDWSVTSRSMGRLQAAAEQERPVDARRPPAVGESCSSPAGQQAPVTWIHGTSARVPVEVHSGIDPGVEPGARPAAGRRHAAAPSSRVSTRHRPGVPPRGRSRRAPGRATRARSRGRGLRRSLVTLCHKGDRPPLGGVAVEWVAW